jgi:hypothetical protein
MLTLAAGAAMMVGGYLFHTDGWKVSGPSMTPAGPLISIAFALESRSRAPATPPSKRSGVQRLRRLLPLLLGVPIPAGGIQPLASIATLALTLLAGLAMAAAGYTLASWTPILVPLLILASGVIILAAFSLGARSQPQQDAKRQVLVPSGESLDISNCNEEASRPR